MEEPKLCVPQPSPYPSLDDSKDSWSLNLTPEKPSRIKSKLHKHPRRTANAYSVKDKPTDSLSSHPSQLSPSSHPSQLSQPHLNSTSHIYHKLQSFKQQHHQKSSPNTITKENEQGSTHHTSSELGAEDLADLEGIFTDKPLKEVNVPRHTSRYTDLAPVDISEQSFEELTTKPRKKRNHLEDKRRKKTSKEEPSLMEFFSPELEWEEVEWNVDRTSEKTGLEPVEVPCDAPFTLYDLIQTWK